jgi:hypothetical protein
MSHRDLQKKCKSLGIPARGKKEELRSRVLVRLRADNERIKEEDYDEDEQMGTREDETATIQAAAKSANADEEVVEPQKKSSTTIMDDVQEMEPTREPPADPMPDDISVMSDNISVMSHRDLQKKCKSLGIPARGKKEELRSRVLVRLQADNERIKEEDYDEDEGKGTLEDEFATIQAAAKSANADESKKVVMPKSSRNDEVKYKVTLVNTNDDKSLQSNTAKRSSLLAPVLSAFQSISKLMSPKVSKKKNQEVIEIIESDDEAEQQSIPHSIIASPTAMSVVSSVAHHSPAAMMRITAAQDENLEAVGEEPNDNSED